MNDIQDDEFCKFFKNCAQDVYESDFKGSEPSSDDPTDAVQSIVDFRKSMDLELSCEYMEKIAG